LGQLHCLHDWDVSAQDKSCCGWSATVAAIITNVSRILWSAHFIGLAFAEIKFNSP